MSPIERIRIECADPSKCPDDNDRCFVRCFVRADDLAKFVTLYDAAKLVADGDTPMATKARLEAMDQALTELMKDDGE